MMTVPTHFQKLAVLHRDAARRLARSVRRYAHRIDLGSEARWTCPECRERVEGRWWAISRHAEWRHPSWGRTFARILDDRDRADTAEKIRLVEAERARKDAERVAERTRYHERLAQQPVDVVWLPPGYRERMTP